jgi:hypothetical protein
LKLLGSLERGFSFVGMFLVKVSGREHMELGRGLDYYIG